MYTLVIFCKTFNGDFERFKNLKESVDKFNKENLPFYCICPEKDKKLFLGLKSEKDTYLYEVITDEEILKALDLRDQEQNWHLQQIMKLGFYKLGLCHHYLIVDSDCYFIKNFTKDDYLYDDKIPYIPISEPMNGATNFIQLYKSLEDKKEEEKVNSIAQNFFGRKGKRIALELPCVFTSKALESMEKYLINERNMDFKKIIDLNPFEFEWYLDYLLTFQPIKYFISDMFFMGFYYYTNYQIYRYMGFTEELLSNYYTGIIVHEGKIKDIKYKNSWIGSIVRRILILHHYIHNDRIPRKKQKLKFSKRIKLFIRKYIKLPFKILILNKI